MHKNGYVHTFTEFNLLVSAGYQRLDAEPTWTFYWLASVAAISGYSLTPVFVFATTRVIKVHRFGNSETDGNTKVCC